MFFEHYIQNQSLQTKPFLESLSEIRTHALKINTIGKISNLLQVWQLKPPFCYPELYCDTWLKNFTLFF